MSPSFLKESCPCGDDRCSATGAPIKSTGHSKHCWDGCRVCAKGGKPAPVDKIPPKVRRQVMARAGGFCEARIEGVCTGEPEHLHHVRMRSQGGRHTASNLKAVCLEDHAWLHAHPLEARALGLLAFSGDDVLDGHT